MTGHVRWARRVRRRRRLVWWLTALSVALGMGLLLLGWLWPAWAVLLGGGLTAGVLED